MLSWYQNLWHQFQVYHRKSIPCNTTFTSWTSDHWNVNKVSSVMDSVQDRHMSHSRSHVLCVLLSDLNVVNIWSCEVAHCWVIEADRCQIYAKWTKSCSCTHSGSLCLFIVSPPDWVFLNAARWNSWIRSREEELLRSLSKGEVVIQQCRIEVLQHFTTKKSPYLKVQNI